MKTQNEEFKRLYADVQAQLDLERVENQNNLRNAHAKIHALTLEVRHCLSSFLSVRDFIVYTAIVDDNYYY
jgi:hypothetical protein